MLVARFEDITAATINISRLGCDAVLSVKCLLKFQRNISSKCIPDSVYKQNFITVCSKKAT
jgi:hypothetical protein